MTFPISPLALTTTAILTIASLSPAVCTISFSTNAVCSQHNCINPVFPGSQDLSLLQTQTWQCHSLSAALQFMTFCKDIVDYDIAIKSPHTAANLSTIVEAQDNEAATAYFLALSGMQIEAWDHSEPWDSEGSPCIKAIWKMTCLTYFPKAEAGCNMGERTPYLAPCKNVCQDYVSKCDVTCCDKSVQCVFNMTSEPVSFLGNAENIATGYVNALGPSSICTGSGSSRSTSPKMGLLLGALMLLLMPASGHAADVLMEFVASVKVTRHIVLMGVLLVASIWLQGCSYAHMAPTWETKPNYMINFQVIPPGMSDANATLNSCVDPLLPENMRCNGHGKCVSFNQGPAFQIPGSDIKPIAFCQCDVYWADPECRTPRKSQAVAWTLSLFFGYLGADLYYIGEPIAATFKLATLGGLGFWWIWDIIRIGSAPVYAGFRLAEDLAHWVFIMGTVGFFAALGFFLSTIVLAEVQRRRQTSGLLRVAEDEFHKSRSAVLIDPTQSFAGMPTKASHGVRLPVSNPVQNYGAVTLDAAKMLGLDNAFSPYACLHNALQKTGYYRFDTYGNETSGQNLLQDPVSPGAGTNSPSAVPSNLVPTDASTTPAATLEGIDGP